MSTSIDTITLGGGCFWCLEAVYERVDGVTAVESGYSNGHVTKPTSIFPLSFIPRSCG